MSLTCANKNKSTGIWENIWLNFDYTNRNGKKSEWEQILAYWRMLLSRKSTLSSVRICHLWFIIGIFDWIFIWKNRKEKRLSAKRHTHSLFSASIDQKHVKCSFCGKHQKPSIGIFRVSWIHFRCVFGSFLPKVFTDRHEGIGDTHMVRAQRLHMQNRSYKIHIYHPHSTVDILWMPDTRVCMCLFTAASPNVSPVASTIKNSYFLPQCHVPSSI